MRYYVIRLRRAGSSRKPIYHLVVSFKDVKVHGAFFEKIGFFSPTGDIRLLFVNYDRLSF